MRGVLRRIWRFRGNGPRPLILAYHRIASTPIDPWGLAVRPARFEAQLDVLRRKRVVMSVNEMVNRLRSGTLPCKAVAITFDDGYADNQVEAQPRLAAQAMPATLFLTAGAIGSGVEFWWDELARAVLGRLEPFEGAVLIDGRLVRLEFDGPPDVDATWRAWTEPRTSRQRAYLDVWRMLSALDFAEREASMGRLREALRPEPPNPADMPMTSSDVDRIVRGGLFEIGGHTMTHPMLPRLDRERRRSEIAEGKTRCEELAHHGIRGFAYPHGAEDADCRAAVRDSGFSWACTTAGVPVSADSDVFALPRVCVPDVDRDGFARMVA
jgi:peptidoglycan/xylan/chitin deacetylase (PgdA/CDA1 family)